jgi:hypothetical protein
MRSFRSLTTLGAFVALVCPSFAGSLDDAGICRQLIDGGRTGWFYYSYSLMTGPLLQRVKLKYDRDARFYFLAAGKDSRPLSIGDNQESVWHIKTVTRAVDRSPATEVAVRRDINSASGTLCEGTNLMTFGRDGAFIETDRYQRHHLKHGASSQPDLHLAFHLAVRDRREIDPSKAPCIRTDHRPDARDRREAEEDLEKAYNFDVGSQVHGTNVQVAAAHLLPSSALAAAEHDAGYGSEIVYIKGPAAVCFAIRAPVPTHLNPVPVSVVAAFLDALPLGTSPYDQAWKDAAEWAPVSTMFVWRPVLSALTPSEFSLRNTPTMEVDWQPAQ